MESEEVLAVKTAQVWNLFDVLNRFYYLRPWFDTVSIYTIPRSPSLYITHCLAIPIKKEV